MKDIKVKFLIIFALTVVATVLTIILEVIELNPYIFEKVLKASFFVLIAVIGFVYNKQERGKVTLTLMLASIFGILGDIFLQYVFMLGMLAFVIDHILLIVVLFWVSGFKKLEFVIFAIMIVPFMIMISFYDKLGDRTVPVIIYAIVIVFMAAKSIRFAISKGTSNALSFLFGFGAIMFLISDAILSIRMFTNWNVKSGLSPFVMLTYMIGQCLLASSIFYINYKRNKSQTAISNNDDVDLPNTDNIVNVEDGVVISSEVSGVNEVNNVI